MSRLQWVIAGRLPWSGVWLNRHYLARELAMEERVVYLLDPRPLNPLRRAREGSADAPIGTDQAPAGVHVIRLPEPPLQRFSVMRRLGGWRASSLVSRELTADADTVVVYLPRARLFEPGALDEVLTVYYCSDDFRFRHDGTRDVAFCRWEDEVLERADLVIGVSETLCRALSAEHSRVRLVENGIDPAVFRPVDTEPEEIAGLPRPRIGFVGSVRAPLLDLDLVAEAAAARPGWSFCLVGWYDEADKGIDRVRNLPNVILTGPRPRDALAGYISSMDLMTCPYVESRVAARGSPLKAFEALAVGRPLVGVHAPQLDGHHPHLRNTESLDEFLAAVEEVLAEPPEIGPEVASGFTWRRRSREFRGHVTDAAETR